ncbi:MAG: hypothetical protein LBR13_00315 [Dysgonamonadaceae bacterium]|jgi:hypothetical protein|nr:hypothetical protein [Dysgonamonadaceae bacterium]
MGKNIYEFAKHINSKTEFDEFLCLFLKDCKTTSKDWENHTLIRFFDALKRYAETKQESSPSWSFFAEILLAAKV